MAPIRKYIYRFSIAFLLVTIVPSAREFATASQIQKEQPKQAVLDSTREKRNQRNDSSTMTESKQAAKIPVPKESIKAELKDGYVEFVDWIKNTEGTFTLKVDVREVVARAKGHIIKEEMNGAVCFSADNGLFVVIPTTDGLGSPTSTVLLSFGEGRILSKYVNVENKTLVVVTDNEIGITNKITSGAVLFSDLNEKTPVKDAQVAQDPKDPNCAIVTGNGKKIARVHTDGPNPNEMVELISEPIR